VLQLRIAVLQAHVYGSSLLAMLKSMAHRGLFAATVGFPLAKCINGNNKKQTHVL
jgi:hypothetical protein